MKRFHSPFEKIQRIQQQQLRLSELSLARAQAELRQADETANTLKNQQQDVEQTIVRHLSNARVQLAPERMRSMQAELNRYRAAIHEHAVHRQKLADAVQQAQISYRSQKAESDGIDQLLERSKAEHRRESLAREQVQLDESANLRRQSPSHLQEILSESSTGDEARHGVAQ